MRANPTKSATVASCSYPRGLALGDELVHHDVQHRAGGEGEGRGRRVAVCSSRGALLASERGCHVMQWSGDLLVELL